ncbi:hypothetical protein SAMN05216227_10537 [Pseudorhodobacter antarcticus]|uniref:Uncharacterized protein n=1 Tax=Pseudorhodobacter antarcticus TaxID=1077947 RepID=A0A1H8MCK7_9RHOB|nr:hypothetical protein SAMN05216227_10537 [Pseudorhodobacter antarcticus]
MRGSPIKDWRGPWNRADLLIGCGGSSCLAALMPLTRHTEAFVSAGM